MESNLSTSDASFGLIAHAVGGSLFPAADVDDLAQGAAHIPGDVTDARRSGHLVNYVLAHCRYWHLPSGKRIYGSPPCASCAAAQQEDGDRTTAVSPEAAAVQLLDVAPIDISGINKSVLAFALLDGARLTSLHVLRPHVSQEVTMAMAEYLASHDHFGYGWFCGRAVMVDLSGDSIDPQVYDMFNGLGAAERAVAAARAYTPPPPPDLVPDPAYQVRLNRWRRIPTRTDGVCVLADVHFEEDGTEQTRSIGFGRVAGHLPTFWMTSDGEDLSRFFWQAVSSAVNAAGIQTKIHDFSVGGTDPGEIEGRYVQSSAAYDPHVTLYPGSASSRAFERQAWVAIDRILNVGTFDDEAPSRSYDGTVFVCLHFFRRTYDDDFLHEARPELGGKSLLAAHQDTSRLYGRDSSEAVFRLLQVAARLLIEGFTELQTTTTGWLG